MIEQITIRNFRSIDYQFLTLKKLTVLVGANDAGKSNVLRALNLFFNNEVDLGQAFEFERDFNRNARTRAKTAKEIVVEIRIRLPRNYLRHQSNKFVVWRKTWRAESILPFSENLTFVNGKKFPPNSKIPTYLGRYKYTYVPAIKDRTFFSDLQGQMYDVLASVAATPLRKSAKEFEKQLQVQLDGLLKLLADFETSSVGLPDSLRQIFESLEISSNGVPLSSRGDGIKIRHIPKLLRFISSKQDEILNRGRVRYTHIWGFEEPENNVEMASCFEMANELVGVVQENDNHQLMVTTHSPVFYRIGDSMLKPDANLQTLFVEKAQAATSIVVRQYQDIDERMGLMPLVAPYVTDAKKQYDELQEQLRFSREIAAHKVPTLFVEGETDKALIECALSLFRQSASQLEIFAGGPDYGSANALESRALAWILTMRHRAVDDRTRAMALFDQDETGSAARLKLSEDMKKLGIENIQQFKISQLGPPEGVKTLRQNGYLVPVDLECLYTDAIWALAEQRGWLEDRQDFQKLIRKDLVQRMFETDENPLHDLTKTDGLRLRRKFSNTGKLSAAAYVCKLNEEDRKRELQAFKPLVQEIESALG
jgi:predicted ATPase